jgi:2-methylisocitrate lyase-like PEP mutase family enzyme
LLRVFAKVGTEILGELSRAGTTQHLLDRMLSFDALNALLGIDEFTRLESELVPKD